MSENAATSAETAALDAWVELTQFAQSRIEATQVPGVAVGVLHQGKVMAVGFGVTNVEHPLPVTDTTLFQIGSITKTFTGTLAMRLVEEGKLDLDAPVRRYVPDFRVVDADASAQVTIRQLLTHMGGWEGDFFLDTGPGDDALAKYVAAMAELPQNVAPGCHWSYNNAGFGLLGYVIARVTGQSFEAALKTMVLEPLGMAHAFIEPSDVMTHRFVVGHGMTPEGPVVQRPWPLARATWPEGGLITHVHDLLRYARFHLGDAGVAQPGLLSAAGVKQMQTAQVTLVGDECWGLSWGLNRVDGVQTVAHSGGTLGQITQLLLAPERQFAVTVLTNAQQGNLVTRTVTEKALELFLQVQTPRPKVLEIPAAELMQFVGRYANDFTELEIGVLAGRLIGQILPKGGFPTKDTPPGPPPPPMTLGVIAPDRLMVLDGGMVEAKADVIRRDDGSIGWLRAGGRLLARKA